MSDPAPRRRRADQRDAVRKAIDALSSFVPVQELHRQMLQAGHRVSLKTVYRVVQELAASSQIETVFMPGVGAMHGPRPVTGRSRRHLVCRSCRRGVDVDAGHVQQWASVVAGHAGFTDVEPVVTLIGTCVSCTDPPSGC